MPFSDFDNQAHPVHNAQWIQCVSLNVCRHFMTSKAMSSSAVDKATDWLALHRPDWQKPDGSRIEGDAKTLDVNATLAKFRAIEARHQTASASFRRELEEFRRCACLTCVSCARICGTPSDCFPKARVCRDICGDDDQRDHSGPTKPKLRTRFDQRLSDM